MAQQKGGFSLIELVVVVALIAIIVTIVIVSIAGVRKNSREKDRVSDLANIEFALTLYKEANRSYPSYASGAEIGVGGALDSAIIQYDGNIYADPKSDGVAGGMYEYWYDSDFTCSEENQAVVFARNMEESRNANFAEVCTHGNPDDTVAGSNSYIVILKQ